MRNQQCNMVLVDGLMNMNINKVIDSSRNWKLAHDVELLKRLEKFSENVICNASLTLTSMDSLEDSLNETFLRVRTVANKFQAIADNQFIENRVQEEEAYVLANEKKAGSEETRVSPETSKTQLLESIRECQNALSRKFETVQVSGIDSEDELANSSPVVLVPKNVYKERRLPHLIGGEQFIADETLGLMSYSENAEDSIESEEDIDETDRSSYYSNSLKKSLDDQLGLHDQGETAISSLSSSALPENLAGSPLGNFSSKVSLVDKSEPVSGDDRIWSSASSLPVRSDFLPADYCGLFEENKRLSVEKSSGLFDERGSTLGSNRESQTLEVKKNELNPTSDPNVQATLDKPLADKSVVRSSEYDGDEEGELSPPPMITPSQSTPEIATLPPPGSSKPVFEPTEKPSRSVGSLFLPTVSTNTLENLAKGRPKLKGNRRPPSRKHRQGGLLDADSPPSNLSNSVPSEDTSNQESPSTQPGSNILSPATDEEDLFVLPAYDLPTDPPSRGSLFNNTLLSPGATIDDGGLSTSPLFPSISTLPSAQVKSQDQVVKREPLQSTFWKSSLSGHVDPLKSEVENAEKTADGRITDSLTDLFSSEAQPVSRSISKSTIGKNEGPAESITDVFSSVRSAKNALSSEVDDIFSSRSPVNATKCSPSATKRPNLSPDPDLFAPSNDIAKLSSNPPLFNDWSESTHDAKSGAETKTSLKSGLQWDILGSDDYGEDLFRSSNRESRPMSKPDEPKLIEPGLMDTGEKKNNNIFSPTNFEKSKDVMFFEDDAFSSTDIFSNSSSFVRLSLPSNARDSLFASDDDDDDDDSLFKTVKKSGTDITGATKPSGTSEMKTKLTPSDSKSRELLKDPLMSMGDSDSES